MWIIIDISINYDKGVKCDVIDEAGGLILSLNPNTLVVVKCHETNALTLLKTLLLCEPTPF